MEGKKSYQRRSSISRSRSELFICFTSRASSSSTSNSSKWILQRSRSERFREGSTSTILPSSASLRRRLRSNGSLKKAGQSSPMILTETTEPSSPKVTCIGQVRVKMKKQGKKMRSKKTQEGQMEKQRKERFLNRNQRWVHLPLSICEGLRSFGAEFCCFQPCGGRSRDKLEKSMSSSGAVFDRWLVVGEKEEEMERERKDEEREYKEEMEEEEAKICIPPKNALLLMRCRSDPVRMSEYKTRFWESPAPKEDDDEFNEEEDDDDDEDEGRGASVVEINAREEREEVKKKEMLEKTEDPEMEGEYAEEKFEISDRIKVAEEENESPKKQEQQLEESHQNSGKEERKEEESDVKAPSPQFPEILEEEKETSEEEPHAELEEIQLQILDKQEEEKEKGEEVGIKEKAQEVRTRNSTSSVQEEEELKEKEAEKIKGVSKEQEEEQKEKEALKEEEEEQNEKEALKEEEEEAEHEAEKAKAALKEEEKEKEAEKKKAALKEEEEEESNENRRSVAERERGKQSPEGKELPLPEEKQLPDCLLMMMYEPKVSMEVSKETWVCSTDFLICRPTKPDDHQKQKKEDQQHQQQHQKQKQKQKQQKKGNEYEREKEERRRLSTGSYPPPPPPQHLPPRASISTVIEQKLVNAVAYEPFVLKRCKSEPMRSTAKLPPDSCFWKTRKLPHVAGS